MFDSSTKPEFYADQIKVDCIANKSSQAVIFLGREVVTDVKVVVKQYKAKHQKGIYRELKIFTFIERMRRCEFKGQPTIVNIMIDQDNRYDGLPDILGYVAKDDQGEIMMSDAGKSLSYWQEKITNIDNRI